MATLKFTQFLIRGIMFCENHLSVCLFFMTVRISNFESSCTHEASNIHFN